MMIDVTETFRRPRCRLLISGSVVDGCHSIEISTSSFGQAGSYFAQIATRTAEAGVAASLYSGSEIDVSIQMGFLPPGMPEGFLSWQEMISGRVDRVRLDPVSGMVTLEGRDYAARLLDLPVSEGFLNHTSSEVAQQLAERCGLSATIHETSSMVGQYYQLEHARSALSRFSRFSTGWDLLSNLAQLEQFDLWVQGTTLHFEPSVRAGSSLRYVDFRPSSQIRASPSLNVSSLILERSLALVGGLPVSVSSWNSRQRRRINAKSGGKAGGSGTSINIVRPNLLPENAQILADGVYSQTSRHERTMTATMPGDLILSPRDGVRLIGIGTDWDGDYRVDSIDREMTMVGGFVQRFTARAAAR